MALNLVCQSCVTVSTVAIALLFSSKTSAQNWHILQGKPSNREEPETITQVHRLRDVSPSDWAYEALSSLSDRYNFML